MTDPEPEQLAITLRKEEIQLWLNDANTALNPLVFYSGDPASMQRQAEDIRVRFLEKLTRRLTEILL